MPRPGAGYFIGGLTSTLSDLTKQIIARRLREEEQRRLLQMQRDQFFSPVNISPFLTPEQKAAAGLPTEGPFTVPFGLAQTVYGSALEAALRPKPPEAPRVTPGMVEQNPQLRPYVGVPIKDLPKDILAPPAAVTPDMAEQNPRLRPFIGTPISQLPRDLLLPPITKPEDEPVPDWIKNRLGIPKDVLLKWSQLETLGIKLPGPGSEDEEVDPYLKERLGIPKTTKITYRQLRTLELPPPPKPEDEPIPQELLNLLGITTPITFSQAKSIGLEVMSPLDRAKLEQIQEDIRQSRELFPVLLERNKLEIANLEARRDQILKDIERTNYEIQAAKRIDPLREAEAKNKLKLQEAELRYIEDRRQNLRAETDRIRKAIEKMKSPGNITTIKDVMNMLDPWIAMYRDRRPTDMDRIINPTYAEQYDKGIVEFYRNLGPEFEPIVRLFESAINLMGSTAASFGRAGKSRTVIEEPGAVRRTEPQPVPQVAPRDQAKLAKVATALVRATNGDREATLRALRNASQEEKQEFANRFGVSVEDIIKFLEGNI